MREVNDGHGEAYAWNSLGFAHHTAGQHAEAVTCYRRSLDICSAVSDRCLEADTLRLLGDTQQARGASPVGPCGLAKGPGHHGRAR